MRDVIDHFGNTFILPPDRDISDGWLRPVRDADDGNPLRLAEMLASDEALNDGARSLVSDFLDRHRFAYRRSGRPTAGMPRPWTLAETLDLARALYRNDPPLNWRIDLILQLILFRTVNRKGNRPPIYTRTEREVQLMMAAAETRTIMRSRGIKRDEAAALVAPRHSLSVSTLINSMGGHRGSRR